MTEPGKPRKRPKTPRTASGRRRKEIRQLQKLMELEQSFWDRGMELVAGVDEAGRGPLAGPVLAAAVVFAPGVGIRGVNDSKQLTAQKREALFDLIRSKALAIGIGAASTKEVDRLNILRASHLAMRRAIKRLPFEPHHIIVDGLPVYELGEKHTAVVDGDAKVHAIACASIIAKVVRDRAMHMLATRYPGYGWDHNVGYGTLEHRNAIGDLGLTPHHRRSFEPSQQLTLEIL